MALLILISHQMTSIRFDSQLWRHISSISTRWSMMNDDITLSDFPLLSIGLVSAGEYSSFWWRQQICNRIGRVHLSFFARWLHFLEPMKLGPVKQVFNKYAVFIVFSVDLNWVSKLIKSEFGLYSNWMAILDVWLSLILNRNSLQVAWNE